MSKVSDEHAWEALAPAYAAAVEREDSFDRILEWPAQRAAIGDVRDRRILDLGCGTGRKSLALATDGAASVLGLDISAHFIDQLNGHSLPPGVTFALADLNRLEDVAELRGRRFDVVICLQSFGYAEDQVDVLRRIRERMDPDGRLVLSRAHPMRFAVERAERTGAPLGTTYHDVDDYSYVSNWNPRVHVTHTTETFSDMLNAFAEAGFCVLRVEEPWLTPDLQTRFPHKHAWMDRYFGIVLFTARPAR